MADEADLAISDMTLFEVAMLVHKQRVAVMGSCEAFLEEISRKFCVVPLDSRIAAEAMVLDLPQADPFDRLIVATARRYRLPLITKDVAITQSRLVPIIW
jgi:PIN domain nuclease of toxin-antitoxin system